MACNNLGVFYIRGIGGLYNPSYGRGLFKKACDLGSDIGCDNYKKRK